MILLLACSSPLWYRAAPASATFAGPTARNGRIAFVRSDDIWTVNPDGSDERNLTQTGLREEYPDWSPDGTELVFARGSSTGGCCRQLWRMNADGTNQRAITSGDDATMPSWSPDGRRLAYASVSGNRVHIATVDASDGSGQTAVTPVGGAGSDINPKWSPDGARILFASNTGGGNFVIYTVSEDGSDQQRVSSSVGVNTDADWSPDGHRIAFVYNPNSAYNRDPDPRCDPSMYPFASSYCYAQIWVMNADGSNRAQLTTDNPYQAIMPVWSPDGSRIAFAKETSVGGLALVTMGSDGTNLTQVSDSAFEDTFFWMPSWQSLPDQTPPTVTLSAPANGATAQLGQVVTGNYACSDSGGSGLATCAGTAPDGATIDTSSIGVKTFTVTATDNAGNTTRVAHRYSVEQTTSGAVSAGSGGTVESNPDPSPADPVGAAVAVPAGTAGGTVSITTSGQVTTRAPSNYKMLGYQVRIDAPAGTWDHPLDIGFTLDASAIPNGTDPDTLRVMRDGTLLADCPAGATTAIPPDDANPEGQPCVRTHQVLQNGDLQFSILTPHASKWNFTAPK
jgi:dipeptidyl aminopeptidase/acylaminoacyl peptidase